MAKGARLDHTIRPELWSSLEANLLDTDRVIDIVAGRSTVENLIFVIADYPSSVHRTAHDLVEPLSRA